MQVIKGNKKKKYKGLKMKKKTNAI